MKKFEISDATAVVTSKYVTGEKMPILYVSHDHDEEESETIWQFHCGNGDYSEDQIHLVRLSTIVALDPMIHEVADLPVGFCAKRDGLGKPWVYEPE